MKAISLHVPEDQYRRFKSLAARLGRPVAELIRQAMAVYLASEERHRRSILDLEAHDSGRMLADWSRSELYDEMLTDRSA